LTWTYILTAHAFHDPEQLGTPRSAQQLGPVLVVVGQQRAEQALAERAQHWRAGSQQELARPPSSLVTTEMAEVPPSPC
jgi:hypothetical protein